MGELGNGTTATDSLVAVKASLSLQPGVTVKQIAAGYGYVLALTSSGNVYSWGYNASGQLGNDTTTNSDTPVEVLSSNGTPLSGITEIAAGTFSMALDQNGNVWTWGANTYGELGNGSTGGEVTEATQLSTISGVRSIAAGNNTAMCISTGGTVEDWGQNNDGQLGDGTTTNSDVPVAPSGVPSQVLQVSSGGGTSYALESDGALYAWGANQNGQFGNGTTTGSSTPVIAQLGASEVAAGDGPALRVMESGAVDGWGDNTYGELGLGNASTPETRPLAVGAVATTLSGVAVGSDTMSYNGDGLRMKRGSTRFTWDTEGPTPQLLSSGAGGDDFIYGPNGTLLEAVYSDGVPAYYFTDAIGSVRALLGPSGAVTATYNYDPYGALSYESYNGGTRARFAGAYLDTGDGLYYLDHRYYDPATGQFISSDPLVDVTGQPYAYATDDPVNNTDPTGLCNAQGNGNAWDLFNPWSGNNPIRCSVEKHPNSVTTQILESNPAYQAVQHGYNAYALAQNPCSSNWSIAWRSGQSLFWSAVTVGTAYAGGEAAGFIENPDATWQIGNRGFHLHYDDVPHGDIGSHLQIDTWQRGVPGSGQSWRFPWPPWR